MKNDYTNRTIPQTLLIASNSYDYEEEWGYRFYAQLVVCIIFT